MKKDKRIKILHVILSLDYGGTEKIVVDVVNNLSHKDFASSVICMDRYGQRANTIRNGVPVFLMGRKPGLSFANVYIFYKLVKKINPDIVHFRNFTTYFWGCLPSKFKRNIRIVLSDNSNIIRHYEANDRTKLFVRRLLKYLTDNFMTNSLNFKNKLVESVHLADSDVVVIPNGVDTKKYFPLELHQKQVLRTQFGFNGKDYIIGVVAGLRPVKNLSLPIRAMNELKSRFPKAKLVLVGEGEQEKELKALTQELGLSDKVHFLGLIKEVNKVLNIFDMFLFASSSAEGMPNAVLEAMAVKVPIVASDISGNIEVLQNGNRGVLFKNNDKNSLVEAVSKLANNKKFCDKIAMNGYQYIIEGLSLSKMVERYENFYRSVYYRQ